MQYNYHDHLEFIKEKIKEIKFALFKSEINSELQLPNNIVKVLKIEEDGTLWFFTSCIGYQAKNIDRSFYAYLDFHRRGTDCRLQLNGRAVIIDNDEEDLFNLSNYSEGTYEKLLLVKMKIMQAEYFEGFPMTNLTLGEKIKSAISNLFLHPEPRIYNFS